MYYRNRHVIAIRQLPKQPSWPTQVDSAQKKEAELKAAAQLVIEQLLKDGSLAPHAGELLQMLLERHEGGISTRILHLMLDFQKLVQEKHASSCVWWWRYTMGVP